MILARLSLIFALIAYGSSNSMSGTFQTCSLQCSNNNPGDHPVSDNNFQSHTLLRGKSGPRGEKGKVGHPGAKGVRGEKGDEGRKGVKGSQGEKGDIGPQGIKGEDGLSCNITEVKELQKKITESDATVRQLEQRITESDATVIQLEQRITELESDATVRQLQTQISQLERESDVMIKILRPQNCSQIKELNPEATTGRYTIYRHIFDIGKDVACDMTDRGVEIASNCKEILDNDPSSTNGAYTISINSSTIIDVYCDMSSGGVEIASNCKEILDNDPTSSDGAYTISVNSSKLIDVYCDMSSGGVEMPLYKNCHEILSSDPSSNDGVYTISVNPSTAIDVYCEMNEGGWTVFQKRFDGSENFRRNFNEYSEGFGDPSQEHWLGLNNIHQLTSQPGYNSWILRVDLESFEGETAYAQYEDFNVGAGTDYTLSVGSYSGTAGDSMSDNNGARFTTYDRDQDPWSGDCADMRDGAWWFRTCGYSSLNAHTYNDERHAKGMNWYHWKSSWTMPMKSTVMKMKPIM